MTQTFEERMDILPVTQAITLFFDAYPQSDMQKFQLEYEGPFLKYEMVGMDEENRNALKINAATGEVLKEQQKPLKPKDQNPERRANKALNLDNLLPLEEIDQIAKDNSQVKLPFQWELDRRRDRTVWKVELASDDGARVTEVKVDAHDGTVVEMKIKR